MKKPVQPGTCATCHTEIFSWHDVPSGGRRILPNTEYRDISFKVSSSLPSDNGSSRRVGFCSECASAMDKSKFPEITENLREGTKSDVSRIEFKSESDRLIQLGCLLASEITSFCGCSPEDAQRIHSGGGLECVDNKVVRYCCQHCHQVVIEGIDHASVCPIIQGKE